LADSTQTLNIVQRGNFDIILLGVESSSYMSHHLTELIRNLKSNPRLQNTPLILISKDNATQPVEDCIAAGADDCILYPFDATLLEMRIRINIHRTRVQEAKIQDIMNISERIQRVLADPDLSSQSTDDGSLNVDRFLSHTLSEIKGIYNADAGAVYYRENNTLRFVVLQIDSLGLHQGGDTGVPITLAPLELYDPATKEPYIQYLATYAALKGETVNVPDICDAGQFDVTPIRRFDQRHSYTTVSFLAVPLKNHKGEVIGVLQMANAQDEHKHAIPFDNSRQRLTESLCGHVATMLSNRLLIKQQIMMSKIENDIRIGRQIQQAFLPSTFPDVPGWEISSYFRAAREVAGDFYDAFAMPGNQIGMLIADVCDKGVGAALFMSLMRSLFRAYAMQNHTVNWSNVMSTQEISMRNQQHGPKSRINMPSAGMTALQNAVSLTNSYVATIHGDLGMFATTFFGVLNPLTGRLLYINGGHCPPFIIDAHGNIKRRIEGTGPAIGMFADAIFEIGQVTLEPEETLFAFTDGVPDARNPAKKLFTEQQLILLLQEPFSSAKQLLYSIGATITNFIGDAVQFDDITMLALRRGAEI
jgi:sigma-B regulation protein RsbU (phosphoserine phosphatase)